MIRNRIAPSLLVCLTTGLLLGLSARGPAAAQETPPNGGEQAPDHYHHEFDNPERYAERWNSPERDRWQKPEAVIEAMNLRPGMSVADLGTGTGYFVSHLSRAVGAKGRVLAVDVEPAMLKYVAQQARKQGLTTVDTVRAKPDDTQLDASSVDRILTVNTWHHIPDRARYAEHLARRLKQGGSVWVIDYTKEAPMGPPKTHRLDPETVVNELEKGGFTAERVDLGLPHQYVVVGRLGGDG